MNRLTFTFVLFILAVSAGCFGTPTDLQPSLDVGIVNVTETNQDGTISFSGEVVGLDVYEGRFRIENLRVVFLDASNTTLETVRVGTIRSSRFREPLVATLDQPPERVLLQADSVTTDARLDVHGLARNETGVLVSVEQGSIT